MAAPARQPAEGDAIAQTKNKKNKQKKTTRGWPGPSAFFFRLPERRPAWGTLWREALLRPVRQPGWSVRMVGCQHHAARILYLHYRKRMSSSQPGDRQVVYGKPLASKDQRTLSSQPGMALPFKSPFPCYGLPGRRDEALPPARTYELT